MPVEMAVLGARTYGCQDNLDDLKQAVEKNCEIANHILQDIDCILETSTKVKRTAL